MRLGRYLLVVCVLLWPALAQAQDFGVMESAETIDRGNFKLKVNPILILGDDDNQAGVGFAGGYGFTDRFDFEAKLALYDGVTLFGVDGEFWLVKDPRRVNLSALAGFHVTKSDFGDQTGVDVTVNASHAVTGKLDIYAALDMAFNQYRVDFPDNRYTQVHVVPGIEYKIHRDVDVLAEFGIALNDRGNNYISGGIAYYVR